MILPTQNPSTCPLKPTIFKEKDNPNFTTMAHHHRHLNDLLHFRGQNLHYQRHPPLRPPSFEQAPDQTGTPIRRRILARVDTSSILTTVTIPSTTTASSATPITSPTLPTSIATPPTLTTNPLSTPKINAQTTSVSRHEIILLALGIFILVGQLALIIWVGVRRRRFSLSHSSSTSTTCAYHHLRWHRENCLRELNRLQLDGRGGAAGARGCSCGLGLKGKGREGAYGHGHIHTHVHGHGKGTGGNCLWKEAFGESPTSPMSSRTFGLRAGEERVREGVEEEEVEVEGPGSGTETGSGTGSGYDEEDTGESMRSRSNSVVIAGAREFAERVRKRSNSLGTFLMGIGAEVVPDINDSVTRKRSHTFSMGLSRRRISSSGGEPGLRERRGSAASEGDIEKGVGRTSGLNTDFGGKFDGIEEHDGDGHSERRRPPWVKVLRQCPGFGHQHEVQDLEKGGCRYCDSNGAWK